MKLNPRVYPLEAIYLTCYTFIDRAYLHLDGNPKKEIKISIKGKRNFSSKQSEALAGEFLNELLNSSLRIKLGERNKKIREYITSQALFSAFRENAPETEEYQYQKDPLGIAVPWEEKYGNGKNGKEPEAATKEKKKPTKRND